MGGDIINRSKISHKKVAKTSERTFPEFLKFAEICIKKGKERYPAALFFLTEFLRSHERNPDAFYLRAVVLNLMGEHSDALVNARCAMEMDPTHFKATFEAAKAYHELKDYTEAILTYEKMSEMVAEVCKPTESEPLLYKAWAGKTDCLKSFSICANCDYLQTKDTWKLGYGLCEIDGEKLGSEEAYENFCDAFRPARLCKWCKYIELHGCITESLPLCSLYDEFISRVTYWRSACDHYEPDSTEIQCRRILS